jgi:formyltetrahydrofolate deformylase
MTSHILTLSCANRPGIVAAVSNHLFETGHNILDAQQYDDTETDRFFMRVVFNGGQGSSADPAAGFAAVADRFDMQWSIRDEGQPLKVMILVSKFDHCLAD